MIAQLLDPTAFAKRDIVGLFHVSPTNVSNMWQSLELLLRAAGNLRLLFIHGPKQLAPSEADITDPSASNEIETPAKVSA